MCQEVFEIVRRMDRRSIETQLALQCAPLITGLKISNLLIIPTENERILRVLLKDTDICFYRLLTDDRKTTLLLFRRDALESYLSRTEAHQFLVEEGYASFRLGSVLRFFQMRYEAYQKREQGFPHEMGLLLGYPIEDVRGFIQNSGENYLYSGYWKVYRDVDDKIQLFQQYEMAKEDIIQKLDRGMKIEKVIRCRR